MFTSRFFNILSTLSLYFLISTLLATPRKMVPEISWRWGTWQLAHFNINEVNFGGIPIGILQLSLSSSWRRMRGTHFDSPGCCQQVQFTCMWIVGHTHSCIGQLSTLHGTALIWLFPLARVILHDKHPYPVPWKVVYVLVASNSDHGYTVRPRNLTQVSSDWPRWWSRSDMGRVWAPMLVCWSKCRRVRFVPISSAISGLKVFFFFKLEGLRARFFS